MKKTPEKKAPSTKVRCVAHLPGRVVIHPHKKQRINPGEVVDLPPELAAKLIDRGDFEQVPESKVEKPTEKETPNVDS